MTKHISHTTKVTAAPAASSYITKMKMGIVPTNKSCQRAFMSTAEITTIANVVEQPVEGFCEYLELLSV